MDWIVAAIVSAIGSGGLVKLYDTYMSRKSDKDANKLSQVELYTKITGNIRDELREDQKMLREDIASLKKEIDQWKEKYFVILEKYTLEKGRNEALGKEIQTLKDKVSDLSQWKKKVLDLEAKLGKPLTDILSSDIKENI